ncbi:MAG TPA: phospholipase D-like domain-containing protein [Chloroflexota bacterium]
MRTSVIEGPVFAARAIAGLHVVTLAWDFVGGQQQAASKALLGFAIERTELRKGKPVERYWLRGIKRFKAKDEGLPPGTPVPTSEHPVQSFQWGDYTPAPGTHYRYRIVPAYGAPKLMELREASAVTVDVTTEREEGKETKTGRPRHDIYFNRGAAGSQAYARKFPDLKPDENAPESDQMVWLSRGLFEGLTGFVNRAIGPDWALRAMLYEFHYAPVGEAFKAAIKAGADVDIRYEAQSYKTVNEAMIQHTGIGENCQPQDVRAGIRHNKFIVLIHNNVPIAVWTGSTNISAGGIFGHSNLGHAVWDRQIAQRYLDYWTALASPTVKPTELLKRNVTAEATPALGEAPPADRMLTLFSLRDLKEDRRTLKWYADLLKSANHIVCMTFAFDLDPVFTTALDGEQDSVNYFVFDKALSVGEEDAVKRNKNTVIAVGAKLEKGDVVNFLSERLTGFNRNNYIHDKFILIDPLDDDPIVVTGTANFSGASQTANDENMLVIRGNTRVADIYFGEFMRIFDHLYARYVVRKIRAAEQQSPNTAPKDPNAGYLKETATDWLPSQLRPGPKALRRRYFMGR